MSVDDLVVLGCDAEGCQAALHAPALRLEQAAMAAGWQFGAISSIDISDDGPEVNLADRCPEHPIVPVSDERALQEAGGPGGLAPWILAEMRRRRPR